jgi:hypothetical protein
MTITRIIYIAVDSKQIVLSLIHMIQKQKNLVDCYNSIINKMRMKQIRCLINKTLMKVE